MIKSSDKICTKFTTQALLQHLIGLPTSTWVNAIIEVLTETCPEAANLVFNNKRSNKKELELLEDCKVVKHDTALDIYKGKDVGVQCELLVSPSENGLDETPIEKPDETENNPPKERKRKKSVSGQKMRRKSSALSIEEAVGVRTSLDASARTRRISLPAINQNKYDKPWY